MFRKLKNFFDERKYKKERSKKGYGYKDIWSIDYWFINIMPRMLQEFKDNLHGFPIELELQYCKDNNLNFDDYCCGANDPKTQEIQDNMHNWAEQKWNEILDHMIFLFKECDEDQCSLKNKYEEEWIAATKKFTDKYGLFGEELLSNEEKERSKNTGYTAIHTMSEIEEFKDIVNKHMKEEQKINQYREKCKKEALSLFSKYINNLWD